MRTKSSRTFIPYVYKKPEIANLLRTAAAQPITQRTVIEPKTFQMILLLLYATGAVQSELLSLKRRDIQLGKKLVLLHNSQFKTSRKIPIGDELCDVLRTYMTWRFERQGDFLFTSQMGAKLQTRDLFRKFKSLRRIAKLRRSDGFSFCPRLTDMRHTFAVHRITSWISLGLDLNVMLPALAAYMGSASLLSSERYLHITPARFQKHLTILSPGRSRKHWRDDRSLMAFLATL